MHTAYTADTAYSPDSDYLWLLVFNISQAQLSKSPQHLGIVSSDFAIEIQLLKALTNVH